MNNNVLINQLHNGAHVSSAWSGLMLNAAKALESLHEYSRWNIDEEDGKLMVCKGDHDKAHECEYVEYVTIEESEECTKTFHDLYVKAYRRAETADKALLKSIETCQFVSNNLDEANEKVAYLACRGADYRAEIARLNGDV
jgi:hypothetical protein